MKTAADRWITATRDSNGTWPVLDGVDEVVVAALDDRESPTKVEIYLFPADEVRARLNENFRARQANGMSEQKTDWAHIDPSTSDKPSYAGSGLGAKYPPIATFPLTKKGPEPERPPSGPIASGSVAQVIEKARQQIAGITGLPKAAVQIEVRLNPSE